MLALPQIVCPAGERIHEVTRGHAPPGRACLCRVESSEAGLRGQEGAPVSLITEHGSPTSLELFCESGAVSGQGAGYMSCPTWVKEKRRRTARRLAEGGE